MSTIKHASSAGRQSKMGEKAAVFLEKTKSAHRFTLMSHLGLTVGQMNQIHPFLEFNLQNIAEYDKPTKTWSLING